MPRSDDDDDDDDCGLLTTYYYMGKGVGVGVGIGARISCLHSSAGRKSNSPKWGSKDNNILPILWLNIA